MEAKQPKRYSDVEPVEIIATALDIFGPNGEHWITGQLSDKHGNYCMLGAMGKAARLLKAAPAVTNQAITYVADHVGNHEFWGSSARGKVATFNDTRDSFASIKDVMCSAVKAAAKAKPVTKAKPTKVTKRKKR